MSCYKLGGIDPASIAALLPAVYSVVAHHSPDIFIHVVGAELHDKLKGGYEYLRSLGPQLNHDLQLAFRLAYLKATRQLIQAAKDSLPPAQGFLSQTERAEQAPLLEKLANAVESERKRLDEPTAALNIPHCQPEVLLALQKSSATERFQELLHQDLKNDIGRWLLTQEPPPAIAKFLREGWTDIEFGQAIRRTWLDCMAEAFVELLKEHRNGPLRTVFQTRQLLVIDGKLDVMDHKLDEIVGKLDDKKGAADLNMNQSPLSRDLLDNLLVRAGAARWKSQVVRLGLTYGLLKESPSGMQFSKHFLDVLSRESAKVADKTHLNKGVMENELVPMISVAVGYAAGSSKARNRAKFALYQEDAVTLMTEMPAHVVAYLLGACCSTGLMHSQRDGLVIDDEAMAEACKLVDLSTTKITIQGQLRSVLCHAFASIAHARLLLVDRAGYDQDYLLALVCVSHCENVGFIDQMGQVLGLKE